MGWFSSSRSDFPWVELTHEDQLKELLEQTAEKPVLFFKHSTRCSISSMAKTRFEREWKGDPEACTCVYLDLIAHRDVSNALAEILSVTHQSPQTILVRNHEVIHTASHNGIDAQEISQFI